MAAQHELEVTDIELLDDLVLDHSNLFDQVPEYVGYKRPKHHFLSHLAVDAWRYGPPRGYWCFGFESFNKVVKAGCNHSWKGETAACMRYWSMSTGRNTGMVKGGLPGQTGAIFHFRTYALVSYVRATGRFPGAGERGLSFLDRNPRSIVIICAELTTRTAVPSFLSGIQMGWLREGVKKSKRRVGAHNQH